MKRIITHAKHPDNHSDREDREATECGLEISKTKIVPAEEATCGTCQRIVIRRLRYGR
jgi:hypothetical protein